MRIICERKHEKQNDIKMSIQYRPVGVKWNKLRTLLDCVNCNNPRKARDAIPKPQHKILEVLGWRRYPAAPINHINRYTVNNRVKTMKTMVKTVIPMSDFRLSLRIIKYQNPNISM